MQSGQGTGAPTAAARARGGAPAVSAARVCVRARVGMHRHDGELCRDSEMERVRVHGCLPYLDATGPALPKGVRIPQGGQPEYRRCHGAGAEKSQPPAP